MRHAPDHAAAGFERGDPENRQRDDPDLFGGPQMAIYTIDKQAFHQIPEGLPTYEHMPKR